MERAVIIRRKQKRISYPRTQHSCTAVRGTHAVSCYCAAVVHASSRRCMHAPALLMIYVELCHRLISKGGVKIQASTWHCDVQCYQYYSNNFSTTLTRILSAIKLLYNTYCLVAPVCRTRQVPVSYYMCDAYTVPISFPASFMYQTHARARKNSKTRLRHYFNANDLLSK